MPRFRLGNFAAKLEVRCRARQGANLCDVIKTNMDMAPFGKTVHKLQNLKLNANSSLSHQKALKALRFLPDRHVLEVRVIPQLAILINLGGLIGSRDPSFFILLDLVSRDTSLVSGQP